MPSKSLCLAFGGHLISRGWSIFRKSYFTSTFLVEFPALTIYSPDGTLISVYDLALPLK